MRIKLFEQFENQILDSDIARKTLKKYYTIVDEYHSHGGYLVDFLVSSDEFIQTMKENEGFIAGNYFNDLDHIIETMDEISKLVTDFYIAPYWFHRNESDIKRDDVYSNTIYIPCLEGITVKEDDIINLDFLNSDKMDIITSKLGNKFIRAWWD